MNKSKGRDFKSLIKKKEENTKANDTSIQGEITSVVYRGGPITDRQIKDVNLAIPFFLLLIFSGYLFVVAIKDGDITKLFSGYDKNGKETKNHFVNKLFKKKMNRRPMWLL